MIRNRTAMKKPKPDTIGSHGARITLTENDLDPWARKSFFEALEAEREARLEKMRKLQDQRAAVGKQLSHPFNWK